MTLNTIQIKEVRKREYRDDLFFSTQLAKGGWTEKKVQKKEALNVQPNLEVIK